MKRTFVVIGLSFLAAQALAVGFGYVASAVLALFFALVFILCLVFWKDRPRAVTAAVAAALAAFTIFAVNGYCRLRPAQKLEGREAKISGMVMTEPEKHNGRYYYVVKTDSVDLRGMPQRVKVRISAAKPVSADISDRVELHVVFRQQKAGEGFSARTDLLGRGIVLTAYLPYGERANVTETGKMPVRVLLAGLRSVFREQLAVCYDDSTAGLLCAMLIGDKSDLRDETLMWFRRCGISHVMAVSGLHLSLLMALLGWLLDRCRYIGPRAKCGIRIAAVLLFMAFVGFSASVTRAGLMLIIYYLAILLRRDADSLNSLCLAIFVLCVCDPYAAANAGMLLSFFATLGLIVAEPVLMKYICAHFAVKAGTWRASLAETVTGSVTTVVFTLPVSALYFGEISLVSPLANLLFVSPLMLLMAAGGILAAVSAVPFVGYYLCFVPCRLVSLLGSFLLWCVRTLASLAGVGVRMNYPFMPVFFAAALVLACVWLLPGGGGRSRRSLGLALALTAQLFCFGLTCQLLFHGGDSYVDICSVGDGLMIAACSRGRCAVVGAGGDEYLAWEAANELSDSGFADIDAIFLGDLGEEGASYAGEMITLFDPETVFAVSDGDLVYDVRHAAEESGCELCAMENSSWREPYAALFVRTATDGEGKLWTCITAGSTKVLVCPEGGDCLEIPENMKHPDCAVLLSENVVNAAYLDAAVTVISAGAETGGRAETALRYRQIENVYSTGVSGKIRVSRDDEAVTIGGADGWRI